MRNLVVIFFMLVSFKCVLAQAGFEKFYFDFQDRLLGDSSGCHYYRISRNDLHNKDTVLTIYCKTEKVRTIETVNQSRERNGPYIRFDENGIKVISGEFSQGNPVLINQWYGENKLKSVERFTDDRKFIEQYWDSLGTQLIKDGNGYCHCYLSTFYGGAALQKGNVRNSQPDSIWMGYNKDGTLYYTEKYEKGQFIHGTSHDPGGNQFHYTVLSEAPQPIGGMKSFYQHVAHVMRYPSQARRKGIQGKVFVEFIVDKDGSLTDVRTIKGIGGGCDEEAVSSVRSAPKWKPGIERGQKVKARYVVPVTFKLG